ncbi:MAG: phosphoenolpyruvate--protein phosphotransferase [Roseburia sp.]
MLVFSGNKVSGGIAIGKLKVYKKIDYTVTRHSIEDTEAELERYEAAKDQAVEQLHVLYEKALVQVGEDGAELFNVHAMMLEDDDYNESVHNMITGQGVNAEFAVMQTGDNFSEMFANMEDDYFKARSVDVKDISERVLRCLMKVTDESDIGDEPVILLAENLTPSETVQMDKSKLLAFVTREGSSNSHTAILARTMSVPAMVGIDISEEWNGKIGIVDGNEGKLIVDPQMQILQEYFKKKEDEDQKKALLKELKGKENVTKSGKKIALYANIGSPADLGHVLENDANGIGLFRSEFLYLSATDYPSEEEQFQAYKKVLETMGGKKVIIRTLDIGADKQVDYFHMEKEDNPALGLRAIRICLERPEIFKTQLRALYRASAYGKLAIMYPMITSVKEVEEIKSISKNVREELISDGIKIGEVEEGIMIETPAAAIISDELAKHVDFFSVGTNDLTQYTLAIDRQNENLGRFYDPHHPAVLRLLQIIVENAHKNGIWAGICGELGADTTFTEYFMEIGFDELSMSPGMILPVRKIIRELD